MSPTSVEVTSLDAGPRLTAPRRIHLVRHAMPRIDATAAPADWPLSAVGWTAATAIGSAIPTGALLLSSRERKAVQTGIAATGRLPCLDDRFGEVIRPGEPFDDLARDRRGAWVAGNLDARHEGWEDPEQAFLRVDRALRDYLGDELVVITHGMVMVAWLVGIGEVEPGTAARLFWSDLAFPDVVTVLVDG